MNKIKEGINQDIRNVLGELEFNRFDEGSHIHKSLSDSLAKLINIKVQNFIELDEKEYFKCLLKDLEKEAEDVREIANLALKNKDYKAYRNWLESLKRIIYIHEETEYIYKKFQ